MLIFQRYILCDFFILCANNQIRKIYLIINVIIANYEKQIFIIEIKLFNYCSMCKMFKNQFENFVFYDY